MKIEKSNNPAAVGALVVILVLIVGRIIWMVLGHTRTAAAATKVFVAPAAAPVSSTLATSVAGAAPVPARAARASLAVVPVTTRNPFSVVTPSAQTMAHLGDQSFHDHAAGRTASAVRSIPVMPLPPFPVQVLESHPGVGAKQPFLLRVLGALPASPGAGQGQAAVLPSLTLTAIIGGSEPSAVVQTANPEPVILHVGDTIDGMRVTAIHDQDVVFARGSGFWTLALPSAANSAAGGSVSVTSVPADVAPVVSVASSEEKTDELQHN